MLYRIVFVMKLIIQKPVIKSCYVSYGVSPVPEFKRYRPNIRQGSSEGGPTWSQWWAYFFPSKQRAPFSWPLHGHRNWVYISDEICAVGHSPLSHLAWSYPHGSARYQCWYSIGDASQHWYIVSYTICLVSFHLRGVTSYIHQMAHGVTCSSRDRYVVLGGPLLLRGPVTSYLIDSLRATLLFNRRHSWIL